MCYQKKYKSSNPVSWTEEVKGVGRMEAVDILFIELVRNDEKRLEIETLRTKKNQILNKLNYTHK